jgi:hypothetical protein
LASYFQRCFTAAAVAFNASRAWIPALQLLFEFRIGLTPEERRVLGHLHRPVARRGSVLPNRFVIVASLFTPEAYYRVFEITKTQECDKTVQRQSCWGYLRWSCCLSFG